jgi:hypothetical protein
MSYSKSVLIAIWNIYCTFETRQCEIFVLRFLNGMGLGFVLATTSVYIVEIATTGTYFYLTLTTYSKEVVSTLPEETIILPNRQNFF